MRDLGCGGSLGVVLAGGPRSFRAARPAGQRIAARSQLVARAACSMARVTASGSEIIDRCGALISVNLWPRPLVVFANGKAWAALTPAQRSVLTRAMTGDVAAETGVVRGDERTDTAILCHRGRLRFLDASPPGLAALRAAVQPVYAQLDRGPQTRRYIRQIEALRRAIPAEAAPSCGHSTRLAGTAGQLDGVYQYTDTLAASLRSGSRRLAASPATAPSRTHT
jgi:hypothetical protein